MTGRVAASLAGERADKVVARLLERSRSEARRLIEEGRVTVDGGPVEPKTRLEAGASVTVEVPPARPELVPEVVAFEVRYEDEWLAVVDKPAGVVVHPGAGRRTGTLAAGLIERWPELEEVPRWGLVHRLDRGTSGLLVVARSAELHARLQELLRRRQVGRVYLTLAQGIFEADTGTIEAPLGRDPRRPTRRAVVAGGRAARTHYRRLAWWDRPALSLVEVTLETGRTHQIRVHFSSIGHPLVGDAAYGGPSPPGADPGRVWLHAWRLRFVHPVTGEELEVVSPLPEELEESLESLGTPRGGSIPDAG